MIVPKNNKNGSRLDPPSSVVVGVSAAAVASTVTNSKTGVDPPPTMMSAAVANIFSQPKMGIALEALLSQAQAQAQAKRTVMIIGQYVATVALYACFCTFLELILIHLITLLLLRLWYYPIFAWDC